MVEFGRISWQLETVFLTLWTQKGRVAERLGRGLQNLIQRFESARDLFFTLPKVDYRLVHCLLISQKLLLFHFNSIMNLE